jgi:XRE family aerobic/anaerobic benzoate catabolism transcriptional regulator
MEREGSHRVLLIALGRALRARRRTRDLTLRALAARAALSERFLAQLEVGDGNISVARLNDVARALGTTGSALLLEAEASMTAAHHVVALVGLRGAGKSTIGARVATQLEVPFVELDARIEHAAGMRLATLFELHGAAYFRRLEREALAATLDTGTACVLAVGGGVVTDDESWSMLRARALTVWLRCPAEEHWRRVVEQGDARPMANRANAMSELRTLLETRTPYYALAAHIVDTAGRDVEGCARDVVSIVASARRA